MITSIARLLSCVLMGLALSGCDDAYEVDLEEEDTDLRELQCPKCKLNASTLNSFPLGTLDLTGAPGSEGATVEYVRGPKGEYSFGVHEEELAAYLDGELVAYGDDLVGWELGFVVKGVRRPITIAGRKELVSWAKNGAPISTYVLEGSFDDGPARSFCEGQASDGTVVTLIHGETYDGALKRIDQVGKQWLTVACVDEAAFKLKRMGYGPNGDQGPGGEPATPAQRTATLKMLTADYCGTGQSFTGEQKWVLWNNTAGTVTSPAMTQQVDFEAMWSDKGALCLTKPRFGTRAQVTAVCDLPTCATYKASAGPSFEWKTFVAEVIPMNAPKLPKFVAP